MSNVYSSQVCTLSLHDGFYPRVLSPRPSLRGCLQLNAGLCTCPLPPPCAAPGLTSRESRTTEPQRRRRRWRAQNTSPKEKPRIPWPRLDMPGQFTIVFILQTKPKLTVGYTLYSEIKHTLTSISMHLDMLLWRERYFKWLDGLKVLAYYQKCWNKNQTKLFFQFPCGEKKKKSPFSSSHLTIVIWPIGIFITYSLPDVLVSLLSKTPAGFTLVSV